MAGPLDDPDKKKHLEHFLIEHAPLINYHANKLKNAGFIPPEVELNDIHMAGVHGLMDAIHKYKPDAAGGKKFTQYAHSRIRGSMLDHIKETSGVPKHLSTQAKNLRAMEGKPAEIKTGSSDSE